MICTGITLRLHIYTHTHTHAHTRTSTHAHAHTETHARTHTHAQTHTHARTQTHARTRTNAHAHARTHIHPPKHANAQTRARAHAHSQTHTRTHAHTHTHFSRLWFSGRMFKNRLNSVVRLCVAVMVVVMCFAVNHKKYMRVMMIIMLMNIRKDMKSWWTLGSWQIICKQCDAYQYCWHIVSIVTDTLCFTAVCYVVTGDAAYTK
jgi:hypothetical protein